MNISTISEARIKQAVDLTFDNFPDSTITMPALLYLSLKNIPEVTGDNYHEASLVMKAHLKSHPLEYGITKGQFGGVSRIMAQTMVPSIQAEKKHIPCKCCKTDLFVGESPCWRCGSEN